MKMSFFGYNRKETDDYFDYLTKANAELTEQVEQLKKKNAETTACIPLSFPR